MRHAIQRPQGHVLSDSPSFVHLMVISKAPFLGPLFRGVYRLGFWCCSLIAGAIFPFCAGTSLICFRTVFFRVFSFSCMPFWPPTGGNMCLILLFLTVPWLLCFFRMVGSFVSSFLAGWMLCLWLILLPLLLWRLLCLLGTYF